MPDPGKTITTPDPPKRQSIATAGQALADAASTRGTARAPNADHLKLLMEKLKIDDEQLATLLSHSTSAVKGWIAEANPPAWTELACEAIMTREDKNTITLVIPRISVENFELIRQVVASFGFTAKKLEI